MNSAMRYEPSTKNAKVADGSMDQRTGAAPNSLSSCSLARRASSVVDDKDYPSSQSHSQSQAKANPPDDICVFLEAKSFALFWWIVGVVRGAEMAFLSAMVWLYYWLLHHPEHQPGTIDHLTFEFSYATLGIIIWAFVLIVLVQLVALLQSVYYSIKAKEHTFVDLKASNVWPLGWCRVDVKSCWNATRLAKAWRRVNSTWIEPVVSIRGQHFDHFHLLRECVEVSSQVYQAYQMSKYIPTRWINHLFVAMIVLNCFSTPVIHGLVSSSNVPLRRLVNVSCSVFLNFVNTVIIPLVIFMPYPSKYRLALKAFGNAYLYDDVWYARAIHENQQLFVTSYVDFVATWVPHWTQYVWLMDTSSLVCHRPCQNPGRYAAGELTQPSDETNSNADRSNKSKRAITSYFPTMILHGLWITGVVVCGIHIASQHPERLVGCRLDATPWLVARSSCVVLNVNCYRRGIDGNEQELEDLFNKLSGRSLFQLSLSHCTKVQIPPSLQRFNQLTSMDLFNVTLDQWSVEACLSDVHHPKMIYFAAHQTRLSGVPQGLLGDDTPKRLRLMGFVDTNLTSLPDHLERSWPHVTSLLLDFGQFHEFPVANFAQMPQLEILSLASSQISSIHTADMTDTIGNGHLQWLSLSKSPLNTMPETLDGSLDQLVELDLEFTQLREVPKYIRDWYLHRRADGANVVHSLYGSPYCTVRLAEEDLEQRQYQRQVCSVDLQTVIDPKGQVALQRPL